MCSGILNIRKLLNTFYFKLKTNTLNKEYMENKKFYEAFVAQVKKELSDFAQKQKDLKKSRKLQQNLSWSQIYDIEESLSYNKEQITKILFYYTWLKHSKRYWANRDVNSFKDYYAKYRTMLSDSYDPELWNQEQYWRKDGLTYGECEENKLKDFVNDVLDEIEIERPEDNHYYYTAFLKTL